MKIILKKGLVVLLVSLFATGALAAQSKATPQGQQISSYASKNKKQSTTSTKQCSKNKKGKKVCNNKKK